MDNEKPTVRPVPSSPAPTPGPSSQSNPPALGNPPAQPAPGSSTNLAPAELTTPRPISFTQGHFVPTPILTAPPPARVVSVDEKPHVHGEVTSQKAASLDRASTYDRRMTPLPPLPGHGSPVIHASPVDETGGMLQPGGAMPTDLGRMGTMNSRRSNIDWIVPQLKEAREVTSIAVSVLGGLSTLVASYLARTRGSNEPELSIARTKDLEQFIRECEAFKLDKGHENGHDYDARLEQLRARFEELLGNASGERKLATPV
ncbi:hypothetical protein WG66_002183 [Moniliophthora roreri]|nr:hypothetical protein WG66_002183 [Moniliophthora roreri]